MKSKKQKQEEALTRRRKELKRWESSISLESGHLTKPNLSPATKEMLERNIMLYRAKAITAASDIVALSKKLGISTGIA